MPQTMEQLRQIDDLWWTKKKGTGLNKELADAINRSATRREIANVPQRWRNLCYFRMVTGRPSLAQFVYGMARRPQSFINYYSSFSFNGVKSGFAATMCDVYVNRLLGHQTLVSMIPVEGDAEQNAMAIELEQGLDLADDQLNYIKHRTASCTEALWYGPGVIWFDDDGNGNPVIESVNCDEILVTNPDDDCPYDVIRRTWGKKTELLQMKGIKGIPAAEKAVLDAPNAYPAFYFGNVSPDVTDIVPYLRAYTRPLSGSEPGRKVIVIGQYVIKDEEWNYPLPFEVWNYREIPGALFGQGIPEQLFQISQWIDDLLSTGVDSDVRNGKGKWMVEENSNVNSDALGDLNAAIVTYLGQRPEFETPEPIGQYWLPRLQFLMTLGERRVHVSEASVKGEMPAGITAAIAIEKYAQIDDQNFLESIGRLEDYDKRCAYQKIILFKRLNWKPCTGRRSFDWSEVKLNQNFRINDMQAYNVGRLAQTVAGRIQIVEQMRANNRIDDRMYNKFLQVPDIPGMFRELNAETNDIEKQLDALVKSDDYIPPNPFMDFDFARKAVERRYAREEFEGAPQDVLDRLLMWRATVMSFKNQEVTPDAPPSESVGAAPMPGAAPPAPGGGAFASLPVGAPLPQGALPSAPPAPSIPTLANTAVPA